MSLQRRPLVISNNNDMTKEQTFVIIKPDGVQRGLVGEITKRFERAGLKVSAMKMVVPTKDQCWSHYSKDDAWFLEKGERVVAEREKQGKTVDREPIEYGKDIIRQLVTFMTAGPVVTMVISGNQAVKVVEKLVGGTEPATSDIGTIRGDFTLDSYALAGADERAVRNLIHCSDAPEEAQREIAIWFDQSEIIDYRLVSEAILYDVNLDGIME